jgi:hypothetical protein
VGHLSGLHKCRALERIAISHSYYAVGDIQVNARGEIVVRWVDIY